MIRLDYGGADTVSLTVDAPLGPYLLHTLRDRGGEYPCLFFPQKEGEWLFQFHIQYAPHFMGLLKSPKVTRENEHSPAPFRTMTAVLQEELRHWEVRQSQIQEARDLLNPPATWRPLGELEVPLKLPLRPYQRAAVAWMVWSENGLLADDVGLGKSAMAIAYCLSMFQAGLAKRVLLLCPKQVILQWVSEAINKFAPAPWNTVQVVDALGGHKKRARQWRTDAVWTITNYAKVREDTKHLGDCTWDILLLDEAQEIRGRRTQVARAVKELRKRYCFLLTATAIDTVLEDLFSLYQCLHPCVLGNEAAFRRAYILQQGRSREGYYIARIQEDLPQKIAFTKLRRNKAEVLPQLPPLQEITLPVLMEPDQERLYRSMEHEGEEALQLLEAQTGRGSADYMPIITKILRLQQIVNSPRQFDPSCDYPSGKLNALEMVLASCSGKVLIFTFFKRMAYLLQETLDQWQREGRTDCAEILCITGDMTKAEHREQIRDQFNHAPHRVCLISTDCMKSGVNMAAAELVVNYDLAYSPATMTQRVGRAHRLGMESVERLGVPAHVMAVQLVTEHTIETRIPEILAVRRLLHNSVLEGATTLAGLVRRFTPEELSTLLR